MVDRLRPRAVALTPPPVLVLHNARRPGRPQQENLVVRDGRIVAVCDDEESRRLAPHGQQLDLAGRVVTAGLTDSHTHPVLGVSSAQGLDLSAVTDLPGLRAALRAAAGTTQGEWLLCWGLDPNCFGAAGVSFDAVADVCGERPVLLRLFDGHSAVASPEALRRAGITGPRTFASKSQIVCDADGRPTGLLLEEEAMEPLHAVLPVLTLDERRTHLRTLLASMAATGLTGGHVMDCDDDALQLLAGLDEAGELPLRLRLAPWRRPGDDRGRVEELLALQGRGGRLWQVAGVKLFMDGTIDNGTAWLEEADCHGDSTSSYWQDPHDYTQAVHQLAAHGVQTATHAIGDAAVAHVLRTLASIPPDASGLRHRIEHIETLPARLIDAFVEHDVIASMQPTHATLYTRADHSDNWSTRLGDERAHRAWPCRELHDAGVLLALGSDWPVAPFDPRSVMADAQLRRPWNRPELAPVSARQALTAAQALAGYTSAPAAAVGETRLGRVAPGYLADLTVWDADPLAEATEQLAQIPIALTVVDGVVRHRSPEVT